MNLCLDIGNTLVKLAIIQDNKVLYTYRSKKIYIKDIQKLQEKYAFSKAILAASGNIPKTLAHHLEQNYHLHIVDHNTKLPISLEYKTPESLGRDRIAGVTGATVLFPNQHNCVIDMGTCITFDVIDKNKSHKGGNISPGVDLRLRSMHEFTSRLPLVERGEMTGFLGKSTKQALQNGGVWGTLLEVESFISRIKIKFKEINIILTGGDADYFAKKINNRIFVEPNLVLIGLSEILDFNVYSK